LQTVSTKTFEPDVAFALTSAYFIKEECAWGINTVIQPNSIPDTWQFSDANQRPALKRKAKGIGKTFESDKLPNRMSQSHK
jgi:hypothetical protein